MKRAHLLEDKAGYRLVDPIRKVDTRLFFRHLAGDDPLRRIHFTDGSRPAVVSFDAPKRLHRIDWVYPFSTRFHTWWVGPKGRRRQVANLSESECDQLIEGRSKGHPILRVKQALRLLEQDQHAEAERVLATAKPIGDHRLEHLFAQSVLAWRRDGVDDAAASAFSNLINEVSQSAGFTWPVKQAHFRRIAEEFALAWKKRATGPASNELCSAAIRSTAIFQNHAQLAEAPEVIDDQLTLKFAQFNDYASRFTHKGANMQRDFLLEFSCRNIGDAQFILFDRFLGSPERPATGILQCVHILRRYLTTYVHRDRVLEILGDEWSSRRSVILQSGDEVLDQEGAVGYGRRANDVKVLPIADAHFFTSHAYAPLRSRIVEQWKPWAERENKAFWRGSTTGVGLHNKSGGRDTNHIVGLTDDNLTTFPRYELCRRALGAPDLLDAKIVTVIASDPTLKARAEETYMREGVFGDRVPETSFMDYKVNIVVDGNVNAWGLWGKMLMGSAVILIDSEWRQWYYKDIEPWVHYVPAKADFSDLFERIQWCLDNDTKAEEIGRNAREFTLSRTFDSEMRESAFTLLKASRPV